jgi:hypothetical protein
MNEGRTVFAQLLDFFPKYEFDKCVARYHGNRRVRKFPAYEQFLVLAFAQLTWRESLRDSETCLASFGPKLYHAGIRQPTARSTLADANENRDWRIFADFAHVLIQQATSLYADEPFRFELQAAVYALDSTTIDLCLSLFPWATFRQHKAAIKLHTLLTLQGNFPTVIIVSTGSVHDVNLLDQLVWEAGSFYIMDLDGRGGQDEPELGVDLANAGADEGVVALDLGALVNDDRAERILTQVGERRGIHTFDSQMCGRWETGVGSWGRLFFPISYLRTAIGHAPRLANALGELPVPGDGKFGTDELLLFGGQLFPVVGDRSWQMGDRVLRGCVKPLRG